MKTWLVIAVCPGSAGTSVWKPRLGGTLPALIKSGDFGYS
jgi:hypothetical protein